MKVKEGEVLERYERYDPNRETIADLLEELSISRQRLYQILDKHGVVPKTRRKQGDLKFDDQLMDRMAENALAFLLTQLQEAREELAEYRRRYGAL